MESRLAAIGAAGAERRRDERLEQACLAVGGRSECAQVARRDAEVGEPRARGRDVGVGLGVEAFTAFAAALDQPVLLELAREVGRDPRAAAQPLEIELRLVRTDRRRTPALAALAPRPARELLADHAQRHELVALKAQDRLQPVDVVLAEQAVAALGALRREQSLVLEVPDLRDRDVRELGLQAVAHGADRQALAAARGFGGAHGAKKVIRYLPIWISSPSSSCAESTRLRLTNVPLRLPWSSITKAPSRCSTLACLRETVTSSRKIPQSGERPIVVCPPPSGNVSPERPPPERTTSAGPVTPTSSSASWSSPSSGVNVIVVSDSSGLINAAPQRAQ